MKDLMLLSELAKKLDVHYNTLLEWVRDGRKSAGGKTVKMRAAKLPSGLASSEKHYEEFVKELTEN